MCNFFAQPDALAMGQTIDEIKQASKGTISPFLAKHKDMPGDRPSNVILLPVLTAYEVGQLLALYEHRTAVQGFIWNINSFDQFGVELGKVSTCLRYICRFSPHPCNYFLPLLVISGLSFLVFISSILYIINIFNSIYLI